MGRGHLPLTIDLAALIENVQEAAGAQVAYMVDMAKADALDLLGETRQALEYTGMHRLWRGHDRSQFLPDWGRPSPSNCRPESTRAMI